MATALDPRRVVSSDELLMSQVVLQKLSEWARIPFCYMLSQDQKYRSGVAGVHLLIQEQPLYDQSTSPCKSVRPNDECRYLQVLLPQKRLPKYIFKCNSQKIKLRGTEPKKAKE